jgi:hypothetical protein
VSRNRHGKPRTNVFATPRQGVKAVLKLGTGSTRRDCVGTMYVAKSELSLGCAGTGTDKALVLFTVWEVTTVGIDFTYDYTTNSN